jgi:hypothetical protein
MEITLLGKRLKYNPHANKETYLLILYIEADAAAVSLINIQEGQYYKMTVAKTIEQLIKQHNNNAHKGVKGYECLIIKNKKEKK